MKEEEFLRNEKERTKRSLLIFWKLRKSNYVFINANSIQTNEKFRLRSVFNSKKCNKICIKIDTSDTTNLNAAPWCSNDNSMVLMLLSSCKYYEHAFSCIYNTTCVPGEESFRACAPTVHTYSLRKHLRRLILMVFVPFMTKCICIVKHSSPEGEASVCLSEP